MEPVYRSLEIAAKTAVAVTGAHITYQGLEHIPSTGGAVIAINHTGYVDFPEATISRSFELKDFKTGVARMALDADVPIIPVIVWGVHRFWTKDHPKDLGRNKFPVNVRIGAPLPPVGTVDEVMAVLRDTMTAQLHAMQDAYRHPAGEYWVPRRLGGGAPTEAAALDQAEFARREVR
ncbi:lysophospholipid acyltransferase family protein [Mycobacterium sp. OTB74]|uniref:lysophospholipid acyltransferase family protein n=1 Tax=Mycobacterium sp. OTB74 TaxID=1853452 RepID=UPI0024772992|nr:lysophospholipid acyltransferase family protein [Mycobacterium sp. OTB74]MDH6245415.1 1-acyl-sn-glycerol-3-phosphate acyltransferase [Mycobacterium sp. OTB74]